MSYKADCAFCDVVIEKPTFTGTTQTLAYHVQKEHPEILAEMERKMLEKHCLKQLHTD